MGYLLYSLGIRAHGDRPRSPAVFFLAIGTLFSDLVDKPLAWSVGILESGRSLGHSLLIAIILIALLYAVVAPRIGRRPVTAFSVGYLSHPLADLPFGRLLAGDFEFATYLVWPLLPPPPYKTEPSFLAHFLAFELSPHVWLQLGLFGLTLVLWYLDGLPGLATLRAYR